MSFYAYSAGSFYRVERDASGEITAVTEVGAEEAVPVLIDNYLHGTVAESTIAVGEKPTGSSATSGEFADGVISQAFEQIYARKNLSLDERFELMHRAFGDSPDIVRLATQRLGQDIGQRIWGDRAIRYTQNDSAPDVPVAQPANVIQNVPSQGTGPIPANVAPSADPPSSLNEQSTSKSPRGDPRTGGDPLVLFSGQLLQESRDLFVRGRGLHFEFVRTYLNQTVYKGPLGYCWDHSYNLWIREEQELLPDGSRQNLAYRSTGRLREDRYVQLVGALLAAPVDTPDATFRPPPGFFDRLEKIGGRYVLVTVSGARFEYNADNFIDRIVDPNGNTMQFHYQETLLTEIIDPIGKVFQLAYDELNRISVLTDTAGERRVIYAYGDNGDLEEVDILSRDTIVTGIDYQYLGPDVPIELQHSLSQVVDAMGNSTLDIAYGDEVGGFEFNRVVQQRSGEGDFLYEYDPVVPEFNVDPMADPLNLARSITRVQHPNGHIVEHWFNGQGNVVRRVERVLLAPVGPQTLVSDYRYNEDGLLIEEARPDGARVRYRYQHEAFADLHGGDTASATPGEARCFGNLLKRIESPRPALGDTRRIVTDYSYDAGTTRLARQMGPYYASLLLAPLAGQSIGDISYTYDAAGNLVQISSPALLRPDGSFATPEPHVFTYNNFGSITAATTGHVRTEYVYFADTQRSGFVKQKIEDANGVRRRTTYDVDALGRIVSMEDPYGAVIETDFTPFDAPAVQRLPPVIAGGTSPVVTRAYDRALRLTSVVETIRRFDDSPNPDPARVQTFRYDACGRLIEQHFGTQTNPQLIARRTTYTPWGAVEREFNFNGVHDRFNYDERGLLASVTVAAGSSTEATQRYFYNASAELVRNLDGRGFETVLERDAFGRAARVRDPLGSILEIEYDAADRPLTRRLRGIDPANGNTVLWSEIGYQYDAAGHLIERLDSLFEPQSPAVPTRRLSTQYWYNALGFLERTSDDGSMLETYERDGLGRITLQRDAAGNETQFKYDDVLRKLTITDVEVGQSGAANVTQVCRRTLEYDHRNLAIREIDGLGNVVSKAYDSRRLEERRVDPGGLAIESRYDVLGRLIEQESSTGAVTVRATTDYDPNGNVLRITTPAGGEVQYTYDARDRIVEQRRAGSVRTFEYDAESNPIQSVDENGVILSRTFGPTGFLDREEVDTTAFNPPAGTPGYTPVSVDPTTFAYTPQGDVIAATRGTDTVSRAYDSLGRLIAETSGPNTLRYSYTDRGLRSEIQYPNGRRVQYDYSPAGVAKEIRQITSGTSYPGLGAAPENQLVASVSRIGDRPLAIQFGIDVKAELQFDVNRRLVGMEWTDSMNGTVVSREVELFGPSGERLLGMRDTEGRFCSYDLLHHLTGANDSAVTALPDLTEIAPPSSTTATASTQADVQALLNAATAAAGTPKRRFTYTLDANSNRTVTQEKLSPAVPIRTTAYTPDVDDRYLTVGGQQIRYDRAGNIIDDGVNQYRYDGRNLLREVTSQSGLVRLERDATDQLSVFRRTASVTSFDYAEGQLVQWSENGIIAGQLVPFDRPHRVAHVASGGHDYVPILDAAGTPIRWVRDDGVVSPEAVYDPFGAFLVRSASWPTPTGFNGYLLEEGSGTYQLAARTYLPRLGRFLQRDPLGFVDAFNLYTFAHHSPASLIDIWGFDSTDIRWGTVAWSAAKTLAVGAAVIVGGAALVAAGIVSAPFLLVVGGLALLGVGLSSFFRRSEDAFAAGKYDSSGRTALAALGDTIGVTGIYEGIKGNDAVTDRVLGGQDRSERLGTGLGSVATALSAGRLGSLGRGLGRSANLNPYTVPSIARPSYRNPIVFGEYRSPQGVVWQGNVGRGIWNGFRSWRRGGTFSEGFRSLRGGGSYWHIRSHFADAPWRPGTHSYFAPRLGGDMVLLGDAPYIAGRGNPVNVGGVSFPPENVFDIRAFAPQAPNRGGAFLFAEPAAEPLGYSGGNPPPGGTPVGTPLSTGYRVIVQEHGAATVTPVTMYPH